MNDLENYLHNDQIHVPKLVRIAMAHYQFETIHPFLDGNGRIGRLLITLYLVDQKILDKPLLYLSKFFEQKKEYYYDSLTKVRTDNCLLDWIKYFLVGVHETATQGTKTLMEVLEFKQMMENKINEQLGRRSKQGYTLLQHLFKCPYVTITLVENITELSFKAANDLVNEFVKNHWLEEITGQYRNRIFRFTPYFSIFE